MSLIAGGVESTSSSGSGQGRLQVQGSVGSTGTCSEGHSGPRWERGTGPG